MIEDVKKCPFCGEEILSVAKKCKHCGEMIEAIKPAISSGFLKFLGVLMFLGGSAVAVYYYAYFDTSVTVPVAEILGQTFGGGRVNNIGLMAERQNSLMVSVAISLVGLVLLVVSERRTNKE